MRKPKTIRNMWIFTGIAFLLAAIINLSNDTKMTVIILQGLTSALSFINAYNFHKKITKDTK